MRQCADEYVGRNGQSSSEQYTLKTPLDSKTIIEELGCWLTKFVVEVSQM